MLSATQPDLSSCLLISAHPPRPHVCHMSGRMLFWLFLSLSAFLCMDKTASCACLQQIWDVLGEYKDKEAFDMCNIGLQLGVQDKHINARLLNNRELANSGLGQYMAAISDCGMAMPLWPELWQPYWTRSEAFGAIGDYKLAAQVRLAALPASAVTSIMQCPPKSFRCRPPALLRTAMAAAHHL